MSRERFPISSELLELLLAFENKNSLEGLASVMGRDPSVVSRNLSRLASELPVLAKENRKWAINALGTEVNSLTRRYLAEMQALIETHRRSREARAAVSPFAQAVLLVINAQNGLRPEGSPNRDQDEAETNALRVLTGFRRQARAVLHVKHVSDRPESRFFRNGNGVEFMPELRPRTNERVVEKLWSSAFDGTELDEILRRDGVETVVLTGFTASECIDATARDASALGLKCYVVSDATASFDLVSPSGKLQRADRVHRLVMASLNALYAEVLSTEELLALLD